MSGILNKIWSSNSLLNDQYTRGLTEQAIKNPEADLLVDETKLSFEGKEVRQIKGLGKIGLFFEKLKLTFELVIPSWKSQIVTAFTKVELLRNAAATKADKIAQEILNQKNAENEMNGLKDGNGKVGRKIHETESIIATQSSDLKKARNELEEMKKQKVSIPQTLALIASYPEKLKAANDHLAQKTKENDSKYWGKKLPAEISQEAMKGQPYLDFKALEKEMGVKRLRTDNLKEEAEKLKATLEVLPTTIELREEILLMLEGELNSTEGMLKKLLEQKTEIEKNIARFAELLKPKSEEAPYQVEEKGEKSVPDPVKEAEKAEGASLTAPVSEAHQAMLNDIKDYIHADVATVWKGLFEKFDANIVKSWACDAAGNFKLELNSSMRAWIPSKDSEGKQDPTSGVVLVLGIDGNGQEMGFITGKLDREHTDMKFTEGFNFFVKPDNTRAKPGYINLTNIKYNSEEDIRIITNKDLKKDYSGFLLRVVSLIAQSYGTVDNNYVLTVNKQRSFKNMVQNWNTEVEVVANEKAKLGVK